MTVSPSLYLSVVLGHPLSFEGLLALARDASANAPADIANRNFIIAFSQLKKSDRPISQYHPRQIQELILLRHSSTTFC